MAVNPPVTQQRPRGLGPVGWARWGWRTLTSMRTALLLLLLLALAAVPGSLLPQQGVDPGAVAEFREEYPRLTPWVERLDGFTVYSSPWFSAVYLLLFTSLVGCVLPRARVHWRAVRSRPPVTPSRLERLPEHRSATTGATPEQVLEAARMALRRRRFRHDVHGSSVAAEKGYLKETGNLVFHVALLLLLVGFAWGHLVGYTGNRVVVEGERFGNGQFDTVEFGSSAGQQDVVPFSLRLDDLEVEYEASGSQRGAPRRFDATVTWRLGERTGTQVVRPNHPLVIDGDKVFLTGNGYAPVFTVRDSTGEVVSGPRPVVFLPRDGNFTSTGVVKVPTAQGGLVFGGVFAPTVGMDSERGPFSRYPDVIQPGVFLNAYTGFDTSASVYTIEEESLERVTTLGGVGTWTELIGLGETAELPDGQGSITFEGVKRFANFQVSNSTGNAPTLAAAALALLGLTVSMVRQQRRIWVRATPGEDGRTVVQVAGLGKGDADSLAGEVTSLLEEIAPDAVAPDEDTPDAVTPDAGTPDAVHAGASKENP